MKGRIFWIDGLRTFAILGMILYHILFDLEFFYGKELNLFGDFWQGFRITIAGIFIFLAGYSLTLSKNPLRQGILLLLISGIVSAITFWYLPGWGIYFGILHLLAISYLLGGSIFCYFPSWVNGALGILLLMDLEISFSVYLLPLGGGRHYFSMIDYFPIIPWLSVFLFGVAMGQKKWLNLTRYSSPSMWSRFFWSGRHSLFIYLIHQPIILMILRLYYF